LQNKLARSLKENAAVNYLTVAFLVTNKDIPAQVIFDSSYTDKLQLLDDW
jgi:hypothetical protein